jgi:hypothetical protein
MKTRHCLLVIVLSVVACAVVSPAAVRAQDPQTGSGPDADVRSLFSLRFVPETQPLHDPSAQTPGVYVGEPEPLSAKRAVLYSLLLPGLGDYYAGRKGVATAFFMVEGGIWISYGVLKTQSNRREDTYQQMAVDYAGVSQTGLSDDFYSTIGQYNTHLEYETQFKQEHRIDIWPDVGYDAMEAYYVENRVTDFEEWAWRSNEQRQAFRELRSDSRLADRRSEYMIALAAANRIVAALFAYQAVKSHNNSTETRTGGYRLDFNSPAARYAAAVSLVRSF